MLKKSIELPVFQTIHDVAVKQGIKAYVVGGYVRDLLLKRQTKDVDILVVGNGPEFAENVAEAMGPGAKVVLYKNFGTANIRKDGFEIEFVGARKESYRQNSRKPIVEEGTLEDDLKRRDFTINALAIPLENELEDVEIIDMFGGVKDLKDKVLRTPLDPKITFSDDPLRMMRAIRFATQLNFKLHAEVYQAIIENRHRIIIISRERIADELHKIILAKKPSVGFRLLEETGLLELVFPDLLKMKGVKVVNNIGHKDNFYHTLQVLDNIAPFTDNLWLRWAALLHDIGKPATQKFEEGEGWTFHGHEVVGAKMVPRIFKDLRLPLNEKMKFVQKLVLLHLRPIALTREVTDSALRRMIVDAGEDLDELMTLCRADITSKNQEKVKNYIARFDRVYEKLKEVEEKDRLRNWKPPITGELVMEVFNLKPSKEVGVIKEAVREAILNGDIPNNYDEAYKFMIQKGKELGFTPENI